jgi:orotate phosphoribosyltransferase
MLGTGGFTDKETIAALTAKALIEIKAVLFNARQPFTLTSGRQSPVYVDCRRVISFPRVRSMIVDFGVQTILRDIGFEKLQSVAGGETAGIPYAAWIADRLGLPMQYIRKKPKGFGRMAQIEGEMPEGTRTILVEDLATDGKSKQVFADAIRAAGAQVEHTFVVFHYGIFPHGPEVMKAMGLQLHALTTWWDVLKVARAEGYFDAETLASVEAFLNGPEDWQPPKG